MSLLREHFRSQCMCTLVLLLCSPLRAQRPSPEAVARANDLFHQGQQAASPQEKIRLFSESLLSWNTFETQLALGRAQLEAKQPEAAAHSFRQAYEMVAPDQYKVRAHALYQLALALEASARPLESVQVMRAAVALDPHPFLDQELGRLEHAAGSIIVKSEEIQRSLLISRDLHYEIPPKSKTKASIDLHIQFDYDSDTLIASGISQARELGVALEGKDFAGRRIVLTGHTDSRGPAAYNETLSRKRAQTVKNFLVRKFAIPPERIQVIGAGHRKLLLKGGTEEDHAVNRRVEVTVMD